MSDQAHWHFYVGAILNPLNDLKCDYIPSGILVVKNQLIYDILPLEIGLKKYHHHISKSNITDFVDSVIMPGFFDMHFHWVQDDVRQMPKDSLLEWLDKYTFPAEEKFANKKFSQQKAKIFFKRLSTTGTIGGACYSSVHEHALVAAMQQAKGHFIIGNVLMNMNSPTSLTQSEDESLKLTRQNIKKYKKRFCFTPRFALSTSPNVMSKGSKLADNANCFKQSHLSETPQEIELILEVYKRFKSLKNISTYTEIYQRTGMLGKRSLMGHAIHLSPKELKILYKTHTALIHCPTSNAPIEEQGLDSGLFNFKNIEKNKIRWALGSDIGGGPFLSMFDVMRSFVDQNKKIHPKAATYTKALYRATLAGAEILEIHHKCGNLKKGKEASFIVAPLKNPHLFTKAELAIQKIIQLNRNKRQDYDTMLKHVYLNNKLVK